MVRTLTQQQTLRTLTLAQQSAFLMIGYLGSIPSDGVVPGRNGGQTSRYDARTLIKLVGLGLIEGSGAGGLILTEAGAALYRTVRA